MSPRLSGSTSPIESPIESPRVVPEIQFTEPSSPPMRSTKPPPKRLPKPPPRRTVEDLGSPDHITSPNQ